MKKLILPLLFSLALCGPILLPHGAHSTVSTSNARLEYTGNGTSTSFTYTFRILDATHIAVYIGGTLKTLTTDYTVTGVGADGGGSVVFTVAPANASQIILLRSIPTNQLTDYVEGDAFPAAAHEDALDKLTMKIQELEEKLLRAVKLPLTSTAENKDFPDTALAANQDKCVTINASGNIATQTCASSGSGTVTGAIFIPAGAFTVDGTQCTNTQNTLNSGPSKFTVKCADNAAGRIDISVDFFKTKWDGGTFDLYLHAYHATTEAITWAGDLSAQCRSLSDVIDGTFSSTVNLDITIATAHQKVRGQALAVTPNGPCAVDDEVNLKVVIDTATHSANAANTHITGATIVFTKSGI